MSAALIGVGMLVAWYLGVLWERIASEAWKRRALTAEGEAERLRLATSLDFPRPMSCVPSSYPGTIPPPPPLPQCHCGSCTADRLIRSIPGCVPPRTAGVEP